MPFGFMRGLGNNILGRNRTDLNAEEVEVARRDLEAANRDFEDIVHQTHQQDARVYEEYRNRADAYLGRNQGAQTYAWWNRQIDAAGQPDLWGVGTTEDTLNQIRREYERQRHLWPDAEGRIHTFDPDEENTQETNTKNINIVTEYLEVSYHQVGERLDYAERALRHIVEERLFVLKRQHDILEHSYDIQHNPHNRSWGIRIALTILEETMPELPKHIRQLMTEPPSETKQRSLDKSHLFDDVLQQLRNRDEDLANNNDVARLGSANFATHPFIHRGYYDSKHKGSLFVNDDDTGENIRKDSSVLLSTGVFVRETSPRLVNFYSNGYHKTKIKKALSGDVEAIEWAKDKFFRLETQSAYIPLDITIIRRVVDGKKLTTSLERVFNDYTNTIGFTLTPSGDNFSQEIYDGFKHFLADHLEKNLFGNSYVNFTVVFPGSSTKTKAEYLLVPDEADFLAGWYIKQNGYMGFADVVTEANALVAHENRPVMAINYSGGGGVRIANPGAPVGEFERTSKRFSGMGLTYNFPVELAVKVIEKGASERNRKTKNNDGMLMNYTAKVPEYKRSFLMTELEQMVFGGKEDQLKLKMAKYNEDKVKLLVKMRSVASDNEHRELDRKLRRMKMPKANPSERPIYLGVELEYVCRNNTEQGRRDIIRDMADTPFGNHMLVKSDSSIERTPEGDYAYGLEIVTVPATLAYHKKMLDDHFFCEQNAFHKRLISTNQCGIHVHVDKAAFTRYTLGKYIAFINSPHNRNFIDDMAGRGENRFCEKLQLKGKNAKGVDQSVAIAKRINMEGRTERLPRGAVNLQTTDKTVEIRIFKSANSRNNAFRKIEFCEALVHFCRVASPQQLTVYDFIEFLLRKENKKDYPCLVRWLASRKYVGHTTERIKGRSKLVHVYGNNLVAKPDTLYHRPKQQKLI